MNKDQSRDDLLHFEDSENLELYGSQDDESIK